MTWIISKVNSIPTHCSVAYENVLSLAQCLRLWWRDAAMLSKTMKKRISTPNFETSSHQNVTAKKPIGNMYFMCTDMAWYHSLSRLEHDMLHSTVWPVHKICQCLCADSLIRLSRKECFFCISFQECYLSKGTFWFMLKINIWDSNNVKLPNLYYK